MSPDRRWKRAEREIAAALGGHRLPNSGRGQPDVRAVVAGRPLAVQVKTCKTLPAWLLAAVAQATRDAGPGEAPVVVLNHVTQGRRPRRLVVVDLAVGLALLGAEPGPPEQQEDA